MTTRASRAAHPSEQQLAPTSWALPTTSRPPRLLWRARAARPCFTTQTLPRETACTTTRSNLGPAGLDQTGLPTWLHGSGNPNLSPPPPPNLDKLKPQPTDPTSTAAATTAAAPPRSTPSLSTRPIPPHRLPKRKAPPAPRSRSSPVKSVIRPRVPSFLRASPRRAPSAIRRASSAARSSTHS